MEKPGRQRCPAVTSLMRCPPELICLIAMILSHVTVSMEKPKQETESVLLPSPLLAMLWAMRRWFRSLLGWASFEEITNYLS